MADERDGRLCELDGSDSQMIRINAAWLATAPLDMRAGTDTALARVIAIFGAAQPHRDLAGGAPAASRQVCLGW
jgi:hypothetical protein